MSFYPSAWGLVVLNFITLRCPISHVCERYGKPQSFPHLYLPVTNLGWSHAHNETYSRSGRARIVLHADVYRLHLMHARVRFLCSNNSRVDINQRCLRTNTVITNKQIFIVVTCCPGASIGTWQRRFLTSFPEARIHVNNATMQSFKLAPFTIILAVMATFYFTSRIQLTPLLPC